MPRLSRSMHFRQLCSFDHPITRALPYPYPAYEGHALAAVFVCMSIYLRICPIFTHIWLAAVLADKYLARGLSRYSVPVCFAALDVSREVNIK